MVGSAVEKVKALYSPSALVNVAFLGWGHTNGRHDLGGEKLRKGRPVWAKKTTEGSAWSFLLLFRITERQRFKSKLSIWLPRGPVSSPCLFT